MTLVLVTLSILPFKLTIRESDVMKTINRVLTFFSVMLLLLVSFGCRKVELPTEGLVYELIEDGTGYAVVDYTGESLDVVVPSSNLGLPVTTITSSAFHNKYTDIVSLSLPDTMTSIEKDAIGCLVNLKEFRVPKEIEDIGSALTWILSSVDIKIPRDHKYLKATTIGFHKALTSKDKTKLVWVANPKKEGKTIRIPASIIIIEKFAMAGTNFGEIILPDSVEEIHSCAFYGTKNTSINIPESIKMIDDGAFRCSGLEGELVLPEGLISLGRSVFSNSRLTSISFPSTLQSLDYDIFGNTTPHELQRNFVSRVEYKTKDFDMSLFQDYSEYFTYFIIWNYLYYPYTNDASTPFEVEIVFSINEDDNHLMEEAFWLGYDNIREDMDWSVYSKLDYYSFSTTANSNE